MQMKSLCPVLLLSFCCDILLLFLVILLQERYCCEYNKLPKNKTANKGTVFSPGLSSFRRPDCSFCFGMVPSALSVSVRLLFPLGLGSGQPCSDCAAPSSESSGASLPHAQPSVSYRCINRHFPPWWDLLGDGSRHGACRCRTVSPAPSVCPASGTIHTGSAHGPAAENTLRCICDGGSFFFIESNFSPGRMVSGCRTSGRLFSVSEHLRDLSSLRADACTLRVPPSFWETPLADDSYNRNYSVR